ncbi:MAG: polysaccharide deacetylase family protein [Candidatus Cloacimonetes bacterium]|nr:polysaccharide deacetylase family protein [Candidatus Cloacimonadota bacterium]
MIRAALPEQGAARARYVLSVLLEDWGGLEVAYMQRQKPEIRLQAGGRPLIFHSPFLQAPQSLKMTDVKLTDFEYEGLDSTVLWPVPADQAIIDTADGIHIHADILGSAFFLLTGYETALHQPLDRQGRFSARDSLLREVLQRPLVNEYYEILRAMLQKTMGNDCFKPRQFRVVATHDVDHPTRTRSLPLPHLLKNLAGDVMQRKQTCLPRLRDYLSSRRPDAYDTFDYLLERERGIESIWYLFAGGFGWNNPSYRLDAVTPLLHKLADSGTTIGVHFGLGSYLDSTRMRREKRNLERYFPAIEHSRQHWLSLSAPATFRALAAAGVGTDSTFSYRDAPGFRAGCCRSYQLFDYETDTPLPVRELPLILMESTVVDQPELSQLEKMETIADLKDTVRRHKGDFVFLWHNHRLVTPEERLLYEVTLQA